MLVENQGKEKKGGRAEHVVSTRYLPCSAPVSDVSPGNMAARGKGPLAPHSRGVAGEGLRRGKGRRAVRAVAS